MIYRLRKKFILISAFSILLAFLAIFTVMCFVGTAQLNSAMDTLTDAIAENGGVFPGFDSGAEPMGRFPYLEVITEETQFSTRFFTVWLDRNDRIIRANVDSVFSISEAQTQEYVETALEVGNDRGWVSDYRYKFFDTESGRAAVFVNGAMNRTLTYRFLFTAAMVFAGFGAAIIVLFVLLSKRTVRPIAESYEKQKQFVTDAGHELKTPLTLILTDLDIVEAESGGSEWLSDIRSEGERMGLLINQLVTLARMDEEQSRPVFSLFDLSGCVLDTVSEFMPLAAGRGKELSVRAESAVQYRGDEGMIRRLVSILLDNAVKYCDPGGRIEVSLSGGRRPVITVENTFRGVEQLELDRLFDRFYRADKARTFSGSFGLGLSIAKAIVQNHRGDISAYKKPCVIGFKVDLK
ncbi:MAG: sensor histidine kinase [Oscillospiraceae bacterium]